MSMFILALPSNVLFIFLTCMQECVNKINILTSQ